MIKIFIIFTAVLTSVTAMQAYRITALKNEAAIHKINLSACGARLSNLVEDLRSDNEIDQLPDDALDVVPSEWLRLGQD